MQDSICELCGEELLKSELILQRKYLVHARCYKAERRRQHSIKRLRQRLPPKMNQFIEDLKKDFWVSNHQIVRRDSITGIKERASHFFGQSVCVRYIYHNSHYCSYSESFSGTMFIPLGKERFLKVCLSG